MIKSSPKVPLVVLYEHPSWQEPLFNALREAKVDFLPFDLKSACFGGHDAPAAQLYFNQASPSSYVRGNARSVPFALAFIESLEIAGARVLNGAKPFALELSKATQIALMQKLGIPHPRSWVFNDAKALRARASEFTFPAILKPNQGGSGARMYKIENLAELENLLEVQPELWLPDNLLLLQEYLPHDAEKGIVRLEFLGGELLYAMRVIAPGQFNLCPSEICHPEEGGTGGADACVIKPSPVMAKFLPYPEVPREAVEQAKQIVKAGKLDVGGIEYLDTTDGRRVFYDVNANSNLRPSVAAAFGFDPFERVVQFLQRELAGEGGTILKGP
jgi:glutathione synthase/RimK-type ligase-like ATP-grasp enzyme